MVMRNYYSWHGSADFCRGNSTIGLEKMLQVRAGPAGELAVMSCRAGGNSMTPSAVGFVLISTMQKLKLHL